MLRQPFDLSKLNFEAIRRQNRKKLLIRSIVPVVLVFIIAMWFILPRVLTHFAINEYKKGNFSKSRSWLTPLTWTSPEQFVIAFNSGTVDTKLKQYDRAEKELARAVAIAPEDKICMAAQNLVFSIKEHGSTFEKDSKEEAEYKTKANTVVEKHPDCFKGSAASGGGSSSSSSAAQSQAPTEAQQQQLQQKEQEGRERQAQFAREEEYDPNNPNLKPW